MQQLIFRFFLWWSVLSLGLWVGGTLFHILVVEPLWSYNPPDSVRFFFSETRFNETVWNFFGPPWMAARLIPLLICIVAGWNRGGEQRILFIIAGCCWVFITAYTLIHIYPINDILFKQAGGNNSPDVIRNMVDKWLFADRFRFVIGTAGYFCLLWVFRSK
ncbi:MAG: DUF1772 domain-containing protein [Bacteroidota bacterium]|nr:DUF1772 domain-containing protein [Bacteroidota bacterium]